jgi:hypothetical protein
MTLREYLHKLFDMAYEHKDGVRGKVKNRRLKNFLNEHDLVGTINGSPHWRRNKNFYTRGKNVRSA